MTGPSPHLSWKELACKDGAPYPTEWRTTRAVVLAAEFEAIRAEVGKPITIGSAYRTRAWNRKVGGAKHSQHVEGRALDLYPPAGMSVNDLYVVCSRRARTAGSAIRGIGIYPTFVHIDVRPGARIQFWTGARQWVEVVTTKGQGE